MEMIGKVRRMHRRDKKSAREIAKATGLSRNTVAYTYPQPAINLVGFRPGSKFGRHSGSNLDRHRQFEDIRE